MASSLDSYYHDHSWSISIIHNRVKDSVKESLCSKHNDGFRSFHDGVRTFDKKVEKNHMDISSPIVGIFPTFPSKVNVNRWERFSRLLMTKDAYAPYKEMCEPWWKYAIKSLMECGDCRVAAIEPPVGNLDVNDVEVAVVAGLSTEVIENVAEQVPHVGDFGLNISPDVEDISDPCICSDGRPAKKPRL